MSLAYPRGNLPNLLVKAKVQANGTYVETTALFATSRIPRDAYRITIIVFLVLAVTAAIARTSLRWKLYRKLTASDYLLIVSAAALSVAQVMSFMSVDVIYASEAFLLLNPQLPDSVSTAKKINSEFVSQVTVWVVLYGIKAGFAAFFKQIVEHVRRLVIQWWIVVLCLAISFVSITLCEFLLPNDLRLLIILTVFDTVSDALLISIPVRLLWNLQMRLSQELVAGGVLSLSAVMIIMSVVKLAFVTAPSAPAGIVDVVWLTYWSFIETDTAVLMLSLTAFKTAFSRRSSDGNRLVGTRSIVSLRMFAC